VVAVLGEVLDAAAIKLNHDAPSAKYSKLAPKKRAKAPLRDVQKPPNVEIPLRAFVSAVSCVNVVGYTVR
jgi:hypothetical protein